jgi:hypothetical protein
VLLALPALHADDKPKDDKPKEEKKDLSPKDQFQALVKDFNDQRSKMIPTINKAKGKEQQELIQKYYGLGKDFAGKMYEIAEKSANDPVALDAIFWVIDNGGDSEFTAKAVEKAKKVIAEMPIKDLVAKLNRVRAGNLADAVLARAEKDAKDEKAADLLAWVARNGFYGPAGEKAITLLVEKYPENPAIEQICSLLGRGGMAKASDLLKQILEKSTKPSVKAAAALALGQALAAKVDTLGEKPAEADKVAAEAEKYFTMVINELAKDDAAKKKAAEKELRVLRTLRVGKEAPEIKGVDLDKREFKLTDYRGKVVMIDFWGNW